MSEAVKTALKRFSDARTDCLRLNGKMSKERCAMTVMPYRNEPVINWTEPERAKELQAALEQVKSQFGKTYPLFVNGKEIVTENTLASLNPSNHSQVVGHVCQADRRVIDEAVQAASQAFESWSLTSFEERAMYLFKAAEIMRKRKPELMAWQI